MNAAINNSSYKYQVSNAGFTLIELMVTIAVLAIIVTIAAPDISTQLANQRVKSTTATLSNALKEAKAESVIRRQNVTLSYDNSTGSKKIVITASDTPASIIASYNYNDRSTINPNPSTTVVFGPSKNVTIARTFTVCDSNTSAVPQQIEVSKVANVTNNKGGTC